MFSLANLVSIIISFFLYEILKQMVDYFLDILTNVMALSTAIFEIELVTNTIVYAQGLAFALLVIKVLNEGIQTYILHQNGDPDADPGGLLIRTAQATAVITTLPFIVQELFKFGTKLLNDVGNLNGNETNFWNPIITKAVSGKIIIPLMAIIAVVMLLVVAIQASIRGAELALMSVIGPIIALNITANNRSAWSMWFKQVVIICTSQALQIFMIKGAFLMMLQPSIGMFFLIGWLWVAIKTPKYIQQFAYSTGFTGTVGGTAKQAGSMYITRKMLAK